MKYGVKKGRKGGDKNEKMDRKEIKEGRKLLGDRYKENIKKG